MGFSRQEYWSALSFPSPGDLSDPGPDVRSPALQADLNIRATRKAPGQGEGEEDRMAAPNYLNSPPYELINNSSPGSSLCDVNSLLWAETK